MNSYIQKTAVLFGAVLFGVFFFAKASLAIDVTQTPVPATLFGMHWNDLNTPEFPPLPISSLRGEVWPTVNPSRGYYNWARLDGYLDRIEQHNADLLLILWPPPRWAVSGACTGAYAPSGCAEPPDNLSDWDDWVTAVATHTAGRIKYWEIWNEPNLKDYYNGPVEKLAQMHQRAYNIIKNIDPTAVILTPSVTLAGKEPADFLENYMKLVGPNYIDVVTFHGYLGEPAENLVTQVGYYRTAMANAGVANKPLWDTEGDWGVGPVYPVTSKEVDFMGRTYLLHWSLGVERFYWYHWGYDPNFAWGLIAENVNGVIRPNAAGIAYREVAKWMVGATMTQPCKLDGDVATCGFTRHGSYQALAVWLYPTEGQRSVSVPAQYKQYRDLTGNVYPISGGTVTIGPSPVLLETTADTTPPAAPSGVVVN